MLKILLPLVITLTFLGCTDSAGTNSTPIVESAPKLQSLTANIPEDIKSGRTIASIHIEDEGSSPITKITLSGNGSDKFYVTTDGNIQLVNSQTLDYEETRYYLLEAVATNEIGNSTSVDVVINVVNVDEVAILEDFEGSVLENALSGFSLGQIDVKSTGDSKITQMRLAGDGAENFTITKDGNISTDDNLTLDYESQTTYTLTAYATNHGGESQGSTVVIHVLDVIDTPVVLADTKLNVDENTAGGTLVGDILFITKGDSNITSFTLSGSGAEDFSVDNTGKISVEENATLDYETKKLYTLEVAAEDAFGTSNSVDLNITLNNLKDVVPTLKNTSLSIDENSPTTALLGSITIDEKGDSEITDYEISGTGSDNFDISSQGIVTVSKDAKLDYEETNKYSLKVKALNSAGYSDEITLTVNILNVENPFQVAKIQANDAEIDDAFASSVAVDDQYIVVGAPDEDTSASNAGSVYVFKKNSDETVDQIAKIQADIPQEDSFFGSSVAIDGDYIVVGTPKENIDGEDEGYTYLFKLDGDTVSQVTKFASDDPKDYDYFGSSVSISGNIITVGAPNKDIDTDETKDNAGEAYIYKITSDDKVELLDTLQSESPEENGYFGYSVSLDSNYTMIGAYGENSNAGSGYLFKIEAEDDIKLLKKLEADDKAENDEFAYSVDISNNFIIIGAKGEDTTAVNAGSAYLFKIITDGDINQIEKFQASDAKSSSAFGNAVAIDNHYIVVGSDEYNRADGYEGSAYLFKINNDDSVDEVKQLTAQYADTKDYFAFSVALLKENIIIGANKEDTTAENAGTFYLFDIEPVDKPYIYNIASLKLYNEEYSYKFVETIDAKRPSGGAIYYDVSGEDADQFDVDENTISFKTPANYEDPKDDDADNNYVLTVVASNEFGDKDTKNTTISVQDLEYLNMKKIDAKYPKDGDLFGHSVSISGDYLVSGAPFDDDTAENAGAAYLYKKHDNGVITQIAKFQPEVVHADDNFASDVAIDGDYIVVGAPNEDTNGTDAGSVYIFKRLSDDEDDVKELTRLYASDANASDLFGSSVDIDGEYITVGAPMHDGQKDNEGSAYLFKIQSDDNITQIATFSADNDDDENDSMGTTISINDDYIVVGAYKNDDNGTDSGTAYLFKRNSDEQDDVNQTAKIDANDSEAGDEFGKTVSISGNYIVIGAALVDTDDKNNTGSAYLFKRNSDDTISQVDKLQPETTIEYDYFGSSVAIDGDNIAIGSTGCDTKDNDDTTVLDGGCAYVFLRSSDTNIKQISKVQARDTVAKSNFGSAISINGELFYVGADDKDKTSNNTGSSTLYIKD